MTNVSRNATRSLSFSAGGERSPPAAPPTAPPTAGPTPLQLSIAHYRTAILSGTIVGHFAHWKYLTRIRPATVYAPASRRYLAAAGLGWACVYLGVLSTITIAQRDVARYNDRLARELNG